MRAVNVWPVLSLILASSVFSSCGSIQKVKKAKANGEGSVTVYQADYAKTWKAAFDVLTEMDPDHLNEDKDNQYMTAVFESFWRGKAYGGVWLERKSPQSTQVIAVARRFAPLQWTTPFSERGFHKRLKERLGVASEDLKN